MNLKARMHRQRFLPLIKTIDMKQKNTQAIAGICRAAAFILTAATAVSAAASEKNDSTATDLKEIVVEGQNTYTTRHGVTYVTNRNQRNGSANAYDLLSRLGMNEILVDPRTNAVTTNTGQSVDYFVNGRPAKPGEVDGLWPAEIRKVEYLEAPSDPKFMGKQYVINYIVDKYQYGGYTRLQTMQYAGFPFNSYNNYENVYSKMVYKKMTYGVSVGNLNADMGRHDDRTSIQRYRIPGGNGDVTELTRKENMSKKDGWYDNWPVYFDATYERNDSVWFYNAVSFTFNRNSNNRSEGDLTVSPYPDFTSASERMADSYDRKLAWQGVYQIQLRKGWNLLFNPQFSYAHRNNNSTYDNGMSAPIVTNTMEDMYFGMLHAAVNKRLGDKHSIGISVSSSITDNSVSYKGTNPCNSRYRGIGGTLNLSYAFNSAKFSSTNYVILLYENQKVGDVSHTRVNPILRTINSYTPSRKHRFSLYAQYQPETPTSTDMTDAVVQQNEMLYITGNPDLENNHSVNVNLSYSWAPVNAFSASVYYDYYEYLNNILTVYRPYDGHFALLRTNVNDGRFMTNEIGVSATLRLLGNRLYVNARPNMKFYKSTGTYRRTYNPFCVSANVAYYFGTFFISGYLQTEKGSMNNRTMAKTVSRTGYNITGGWGNGAWNVQLSVYNFLNWGWKSTTKELDMGNFSQYDTANNGGNHFSLGLTASYTFGYGKKVDRSERSTNIGGGSSAILK